MIRKDKENHKRNMRIIISLTFLISKHLAQTYSAILAQTKKTNLDYTNLFNLIYLNGIIT